LHRAVRRAAVTFSGTAVIAQLARITLPVAALDEAHAGFAGDGTIVVGVDGAHAGTTVVPDHRVAAHDVAVVTGLAVLNQTVPAVLDEYAGFTPDRNGLLGVIEGIERLVSAQRPDTRLDYRPGPIWPLSAQI
jgi:hypothetical protein